MLSMLLTLLMSLSVVHWRLAPAAPQSADINNRLNSLAPFRAFSDAVDAADAVDVVRTRRAPALIALALVWCGVVVVVVMCIV